MHLFPAYLSIGLLSQVLVVTLDTEGLPDTGLDTSTWQTGSLPSLEDLVNLNDIQLAAKNALAPADYAYYRTAALDEITYMANMNDWSKIKLNGFSFTNVSKPSLATSILGHNFSAPFFIAPAAKAGRASPGAETNLAKAAGNSSILYVPSISATQSIETIGQAAIPGQVMFHQEYIWSNNTKLQNELSRIEKSGFRAIVLTVDNTVSSNKRCNTYVFVTDHLHGVNGIRDRSSRFSKGGDTGHSSTFTLESLNQLRNMTKLPVIPKGVKTAHDVKLCADLGFPAVYISNHGGRVVDLAPTAVEILLETRKLYPEVFDRIEIYADGGVRRASHIIALVVLGVRAVGLGRSPMFANAYGQEGVQKPIDIMRLELETELALIGQSHINDLRGNTTFINTKKVEMDLFGAPLF